jgi:uncharacterized protein
VALANPLNGVTTSGTLSLLILQPTPFCNLDCAYCYLPARNDRRRMELSTLRAALTRVVEAEILGDRLSIVWHAGEPMVVRPDWYEAAFAAVAETLPANLVFEHYIQTNGTLVNEQWCKLIRSHRVRVGVSLDGPPDLHNARRLTRAGGPTYKQVMRGVRFFQDFDIPVHAICVLTRDHLDHPDEIWDFFVQAGISELGFNVEEVDGINTWSSLDVSAVGAFRSFFDRILHRYRADPGQMTIREIERVLDSLLDPKFGLRGGNPQTVPFGIVTIGWDGSVSTFSPELLGLSHPVWGGFVFGNVLNNSFREIAADKRFRRLTREISSGVAACQSQCPYFGICGGGAPANKLGETDRFDSTETLFCTLTEKIVVETVLGALAQDLRMSTGSALTGLDYREQGTTLVR